MRRVAGISGAPIAQAMPDLAERLLFLVPLILSLSVHEWAHARTAYALGDDTASLLGRCTLDPLAHIDLMGTIVLPLLGVPFGWAKPVPVNPLRFDRRYSMTGGMMLTALAGPLSNVALAALSALLFAVAVRSSPFGEDLSGPIQVGLLFMVQVNVALAIFNLIPVPPLDGSRVANHFMPLSLRPLWIRIQMAGPLALLVLLLFLNVFGGVLASAIGWGRDFLLGLFGVHLRAF